MGNGGLSSFLEISFGINIVWSTFSDVNNKLLIILRGKCDELLALTKTTEINGNGNRSFLILLEKVEKIIDCHNKIQRNICMFFRIIALLFSVGIIGVLFLGYYETLGGWCSIFILPLPIYIVSGYAVFSIFYFYIKRKTSKYSAFINEFVLPESVTSTEIPS